MRGHKVNHEAHCEAIRFMLMFATDACSAKQIHEWIVGVDGHCSLHVTRKCIRGMVQAGTLRVVLRGQTKYYLDAQN